MDNALGECFGGGFIANYKFVSVTVDKACRFGREIDADIFKVIFGKADLGLLLDHLATLRQIDERERHITACSFLVAIVADFNPNSNATKESIHINKSYLIHQISSRFLFITKKISQLYTILQLCAPLVHAGRSLAPRRLAIACSKGSDSQLQTYSG